MYSLYCDTKAKEAGKKSEEVAEAQALALAKTVLPAAEARLNFRQEVRDALAQPFFDDTPNNRPAVTEVGGWVVGAWWTQ